MPAPVNSVPRVYNVGTPRVCTAGTAAVHQGTTVYGGVVQRRCTTVYGSVQQVYGMDQRPTLYGRCTAGSTVYGGTAVGVRCLLSVILGMSSVGLRLVFQVMLLARASASPTTVTGTTPPPRPQYVPVQNRRCNLRYSGLAIPYLKYTVRYTVRLGHILPKVYRKVYRYGRVIINLRNTVRYTGTAGSSLT